MRPTFARGYCLAPLALGTLALTACQTPAPTSQPVVATAPPPIASSEEVSLFGDHPDAERVPAQTRLLTNLTRHTFTSVGRDFDPDLSPDGQTLAFASTRNSERPDIFLKHVDGFAVTQLTADPADDIQPRFSPNAQKVVFCSNRAGNWDVWLVNCDGTGLTQLTDSRTDEVAPCFSPDGQRVAFTAWGQRSHQWETWMLALDRPGLRRFLCYGMFPDFSPDGKRIAFQRARQRGTRWFSVWTIELVADETRHPTELAWSDSTACIAPRWSPDGRSLAYCAVRQTADPPDHSQIASADVWTLDVDSGARLKITDGAASAFTPAWSHDNRIYFVSARSGVENIWSLKPDLDDYPLGRRAEIRATLSQAAANAPVEAH